MSDSVTIKITGDDELFLADIQNKLTAAKELTGELAAIIEGLSAGLPSIDV